MILPNSAIVLLTLGVVYVYLDWMNHREIFKMAKCIYEIVLIYFERM